MFNIRQSLFKRLWLIPFISLTVLFFQNCGQSSFSTSFLNAPASTNQNPDPFAAAPLPSIPTIYKPVPREMNLDVSLKGRVMGAWGSFTDGSIGTSVYCLDPVYNQTYYSKILVPDLQSEGAAIIIRPDGFQALVMSRILSAPNDFSNRIYKLWLVDSKCNVKVGPIDYPGNSEYRSFDANSSGQFVVAMDNKVAQAIDLYFYSPAAVEVARLSVPRPAQNTQASSNYAFTVSLNDAGQVLLTSQGGTREIIGFRRFSIAGTAIDANWKIVEGTSGRSSSYASHVAGINAAGDFVVLWADNAGSAFHANFYDKNAILIRSVDVASNRPDSGFRNSFSDLRRHFKIRSSKNLFFLPSHWGGSFGFPSQISVYSSQGIFIKDIVIPGDPESLDTREIDIDEDQKISVRTLDGDTLVRVQGNW